MLLEIDDNKSLGEVQEKFTESFPCLKIAFYKQAHKRQQVPDPSAPFEPHLLVSAIRKIHEPTVLEVKSWDKTTEVEKKFKKQCGLNVQVLRLQDTRWVPASGTGGLTLQQLSDRTQASVKGSGQQDHGGDEEVYYEVSYPEQKQGS